MGATVGREADALVFLAALADEPYRFDFYQTMRRLECLYASKPRWGRALRPADEPVRLGQEPDLAFAPAPLASFDTRGRRPRLSVRLFGLLGPNGPLPLHLTEYARERIRQANDPTFSRFLDLYHHRLLTLFYRAWAQAQPHVNRDRPAEDRFVVYWGAFFGGAGPAFQRRDAVPDAAKLHHVGWLIRPARSAGGLAAILRSYFRVPVDVQEFVGHWMTLGPAERTYLGREPAVLGGGAALGSRVWDRQHKFRLHIGPLNRRDYESFLPGGERLRELVALVRLYLNFEYDWDVCLRLQGRQVPLPNFGGRRLGWTTWLGVRRGGGDRSDLCLNAEAFAGRSQPT
jgi:type VI secretion system protein ImpH